jgi:predicted dehydrogenase
MNEIRLAVHCPDLTTHAGIAARLHGATVAPFRESNDGCSAVVVIGADPTAVQRLLPATGHALLVAEPCPSAEGIATLLAATRESGSQLCIANPDRYLPSRQLIRKQLSAIGDPGLVRIHRWEPPSAAPASAGLPDAMLRDIDTTLWLVGRKPDRVFAVEGQGGAGRVLQVHLGFPHGGMALLDYTNRLPPGDGYQSLSVIAASGAAYADDHQNTQLLYRGGTPQAVRTEERTGLYAAIAQDFVNAIREGRDLSAGVSAWNDVFAVADAAVKSLAVKQAVAPEGR